MTETANVDLSHVSCFSDLAAGIVWIAKKTVKNFIYDPSSNVLNYVEFTIVMAGSIALKQYLKDQKILSQRFNFETFVLYWFVRRAIRIVLAGGNQMSPVVLVFGSVSYFALRHCHGASRNDP